MARLKLYFTYDGSAYNGWQVQKNTSNTIQHVLESKLSMIANARVSVMASGRTDAGVHARIQVAHATVPDTTVARLMSPAEPFRLLLALNSLLPPDIRMLKIERVPEAFHALRDVQKKTYLYFVDTSPVQLPQLRSCSWHLRFPLDQKAMDEAARMLVGRHDFRAFCAADTTAKTTVRTLHEAYWQDVDWPLFGGVAPLKVFRVTGTGFLKHMVRCLVGSLIHIGNGRSSPEMVQKCLEGRDRRSAGPTAPAKGLWLWDILY